jgi:hypothetical protein
MRDDELDEATCGDEMTDTDELAYDQIAAAVEPLDGWMSPDQGRRLFAAAARCAPAGTIVEIGSFRGKSTVVLASAAPAGVQVVAIDPHAGNDRGPQEFEGFEAEAADDHAVFLANLRAGGVADRVRHVRAFSHAAHGEVTEPVDVLYVDGAHRFGPARADIRDWGARVTDGGTMLIHDSFSSVGVTLAIFAELASGRRFRYVGRSRSLAEFRAEPCRGAGPRLRNLGRLSAQLPWFAKNLLLKVALLAGLGRVLARAGRPVPEWPY